MWSRIHLIPVLQAEEDRDLVRRHWAEQAREKELLGANSKVYNNDRYVANTCKHYGDANSSWMLTLEQVRASHIRSHTSRDHQIDKGESGHQKGRESHVVYIAGSGAFFHVGNHRPMTVSNVRSNLDILAHQVEFERLDRIGLQAIPTHVSRRGVHSSLHANADQRGNLP